MNAIELVRKEFWDAPMAYPLPLGSPQLSCGVHFAQEAQVAGGEPAHKSVPPVRGWADAIQRKQGKGMNEEVSRTLRQIYATSRQELYSYAVSITRHRESAEDAIQQAFERLLRRGELPGDLRPYVFRAVRNAALDGLRRSKVRADTLFLAGAEPSGASPWDGHAAQDLEEALQEISTDEREAIVLKTYGSLTFQEIAAIRGVPLPTVASWYRRGLEKLRSAMTKETPR